VRDKAGHDSAPKAFRLKYDATPPSLSTVIAQVGNKFALLKWKISTDVASVRVIRTPGRNGEAESVIYSGKADFYKDNGIDNRAKYEYRVSAADEAANNTAEVTADAMPLPPLYNPAAGARVKTPVVFEWLSVEKATYYNLQVWCGKRKGADFMAEDVASRRAAQGQVRRPRVHAPEGRHALPLVRLARLRPLRRPALRQARGAEHVQVDALGAGLAQPRREHQDRDDAEAGEREVDRGVRRRARGCASERGSRGGPRSPARLISANPYA
jgi:hypothetical protein